MIGLITLVLMSALLIVGMIMMGANRRSLGSAAVLGIVGCVLLLLGGLFTFLLPLLVDAFGVSFSDVVTAWNLISFVFHAGGTGLLIWAVIAKRNPPQYAQPQAPGGWQQQQAWPGQHPHRS